MASYFDNILGNKSSSTSSSGTGPLDNILANKKKVNIPAKIGDPIDFKIQEVQPSIIPPASIKTGGVTTPLTGSGKNLLETVGDFLSKPQFMQDIGRGLAESDEESAAEKILKTTSSLVGGSSPENLPFGVGEVIKQSKQYLNTPVSEFSPNVTFGDWVTGMKQAGQGFIGNIISGATELPNIATGGAYQPEIKFNIPGIGEITNSDYKIAQRVSAGENPNVAVVTEKANGFLNALFFLGLTSRAFTYRHTTIGSAKTNILPLKSGVVTAPKVKSFELYRAPVYTQRLSPTLIEGLKKQGMKFKAEIDPNLPTYFKMSRTPTGLIKMDIVQVRHSYFAKFISPILKVTHLRFHLQN
jgi:hypothetical protein